MLLLLVVLLPGKRDGILLLLEVVLTALLRSLSVSMLLVLVALLPVRPMQEAREARRATKLSCTLRMTSARPCMHSMGAHLLAAECASQW